MVFVKLTETNLPPVGERVLCRTEYWQDSTPAFWVDPKDRKEYYVVLYWDGKVWRDGWKEFEWGNYHVTHYALIESPNIE